MIIEKVKSQCWKQTHKHGIKSPKTVEEALAMDAARQGNHLWRDALKKEIRTAKEACMPSKHPSEGCVTPQETRHSQQKHLIRHTEMKCHMVLTQNWMAPSPGSAAAWQTGHKWSSPDP